MSNVSLLGVPVFLFACAALGAACDGSSPESDAVPTPGDSSDRDGAVSDGASTSSSTSSGASVSSSSGSAMSSSSSGSSSSTSSSGGDAGSTCPEPLLATIGPANAASCGALLPDPQAAAAIVQGLGAPPVFGGGTIPPGQYELVKVESSLGGATSIRSLLVFNDQGIYSEAGIDYGGPAGDQPHDSQGTWSTNGTAIALTLTCAHPAQSLPLVVNSNYSVHSDGCDTVLEVGIAAARNTYRLRRQP